MKKLKYLNMKHIYSFEKYSENLIIEQITSLIPLNESVSGLKNETFNKVLNKVKEKARKGFMTLAIVTALLGQVNFTQAQASELKQVVKTEQSDVKKDENVLQKGLVMYTASFDKGMAFVTAKYSIKIEKDNQGKEVYVGYISLNQGSAKIKTDKGYIEIGSNPVEVYRGDNSYFIKKVMPIFAKETVESNTLVGKNLNWDSSDNINFSSSESFGKYR